MEYREDLRKPVKVWGPTWLPPRAYTSYFYFFAYDHTARAIAHRGERASELLGRLRDDILRVVEADGTWLDFETIGKPYGTAMALHILYLGARPGIGIAPRVEPRPRQPRSGRSGRRDPPSSACVGGHCAPYWLDYREDVGIGSEVGQAFQPDSVRSGPARSASGWKA